MRWLQRIYDRWLRRYPTREILCGGPFYVRYPAGEKSVGMPYHQAKNYADAFGGRVWHINQRETHDV